MIRMGFPSVGSWVTYGLGSETQNLPAFVVIYDSRGGPFGGPANWSAGFMPAAYQGTVFRPAGDSDRRSEAAQERDAGAAARPARSARETQRMDLEKYPGNSELAARISSYELAYRMQGCAPEAVDRELRVGCDAEALRAGRRDHRAVRPAVPDGAPAGRARRALRAAVSWRPRQSEHRHVGCARRCQSNHTQHAAEVDRPIAGLLTDLKARGLLDSTLVVWHGEFGRMPISQRGVGRDHNPGAMTIWMAGAKIKGGQIIGASDEFGYKAEEQPISVHDLHATMLHLLGLDHTKLTYRFNGRNMRLTDVYGELIPQIAKT